MGSLGERIELAGSTEACKPSPSGAVVRVDGRDRHVLVTETGVIISPCKTTCSDITELSVSMTDVIGAELEKTSSSKEKNSSRSQTASMVLHYVQHKVKDKTLRPGKVRVSGASEHITNWSTKIREYCSKVPGRPHNLLVVINPIAGNRDGCEVYAKKAGPLFQLAYMNSTVIRTEKKREAVELTENLDLSQYDGLVMLGGDGLYSEILEGIVRQMQRKAAMDINDIDNPLAPIMIPIGIIPTGTGNAVSRWANGITDVYTSILNVIRGQQQRAQISRVHSNGAFLCMSGVNVVYGMMSDMMKRSDKLRWMRTKRYPYAMFRMVIGRKRLFHCNVQYKTTTSSNSQHLNSGKSNGEPPAMSRLASDGTWQNYDAKGQRFRCLVSFSCDLADTEGTQSVQFLTGNTAHLIMDHGCFAPKYLKYLLNYVSPVKSMNTTPKIVVLKDLTAFRITLIENDEVYPRGCCASRAKDRELERHAAVDGEVIPLSQPMLDVRIYGGFVPLFGCVDQPEVSNVCGGVKNGAFEPAIEDEEEDTNENLCNLPPVI